MYNRAVLEGLSTGYDTVKSPLRKDFMDGYQNVVMSEIRKITTNCDVLYVVKAIIYYCEMNQDIYNQEILDALVSYAMQTSGAIPKKKFNMRAFSANFNKMHPFTQATLKYLFGELYIEIRKIK